MPIAAAQEKHEAMETSAPATAAGRSPVSVLIATRNRGASLVPTLQTLLASEYPDFELLIVDQSPGDETKNAVAPFLGDARLRYMHVPAMSGLGKGHNTGLAAAKNDVVIITDDDVEVPANYLSVMRQILVENPRVAVAFCNVEAAPHDPRAGFVPIYHRDDELLLTSIKGKTGARGIGAGMAVRRSHLQKIGGFDEMLGPGAPLQGAEDSDIPVRALLLGYEVYETARVSVLHFGFRRHDEGRELSRRNWFGIGAAFAKPLMAGRWEFLPAACHEFFRHALWPPVWAALRLKKPQGVTCVIYFVKGFAQALKTPLDKARLVFIPPGGLPDFVQSPDTTTSEPPAKAFAPHA